jgi:hypothetical protein
MILLVRLLVGEIILLSMPLQANLRVKYNCLGRHQSGPRCFGRVLEAHAVPFCTVPTVDLSQVDVP